MDYVLPYVDCDDPVWIEQYKSVMQTRNCIKNMDRSRFRPFGTLKYVFRSVAKNMPFIDRIVLIVSTKSQVPEWVNRDTVRIVPHDEFMPGTHRPCFNSSVIEGDMWRIDGLSECFVYGNDDFFALKPLELNDFFDGDKPRLKFSESDYHVRNIFHECCRNGMDMIADALDIQRTDPYTLLKPQHCMKGIRADHMKEVGRLCGHQIDRLATVMRHRRNVTGYIYHYYALYTSEYSDFVKDFQYAELTDEYDEVTKIIKKQQASMLCINDSGELSLGNYESACLTLTDSFERVFPEVSRYELS